MPVLGFWHTCPKKPQKTVRQIVQGDLDILFSPSWCIFWLMWLTPRVSAKYGSFNWILLRNQWVQSVASNMNPDLIFIVVALSLQAVRKVICVCRLHALCCLPVLAPTTVHVCEWLCDALVFQRPLAAAAAAALSLLRRCKQGRWKWISSPFHEGPVALIYP